MNEYEILLALSKQLSLSLGKTTAVAIRLLELSDMQSQAVAEAVTKTILQSQSFVTE